MNAGRLVETPVEQVRVGDRIFVSRLLGVRRVAEILEYATLGLEQVDCFVILYDAPGPGMTFEKRSGVKGHIGSCRRDIVGLRPYRRGELVQLERLHLVEAGR
jgi:hypothetical protein